MASYLILEPSTGSRDRTEQAITVRDGFAFFAFVIPFFWFLWHRMWLEALAYLVVAILLGGLGMLPGYGILAPLLSLLLSLLIGLEAQALRIAALRRRGWEVWGVAEAASHAEAELRYLAEVGDSSPAAVPPVVSATPRSTQAGSAAGPDFGLIDYPRKS
jgi:hypothetical protein